MNNFNVIDSFLQTFILYIDSGFGLLSSSVAGLASILVAIDITLAAVFWLLDGEANVMARLIKKILYVGAFAFIINNFSSLATIIFNSFSQLGLQASGNGLSAQSLLQPGQLAGTGFQAAWPLLQEAGKLMGFTSFFNHVVTILVLVGAWFIIVLAFFVLAVQLFITILEFKLTTLAGFVLVPFALWNKTSFLAERVLGNVVSSGVKVMVLAVIIGIGSSFFSQFVNALGGQDPTLASAMTLVLAALSLFGLGIFGPGIASGLVSGGPQLGAGAALGATGALIGGAALGGAAAMGAARAAGGSGLAAIRAGSALSSGASTAYGFARATSGEGGAAGMAAGVAGVAKAAAGAATGRASAAGGAAAWRATGGSGSPGSSGSDAPANDSAPQWARQLRAEQQNRAHAQHIVQAIKEGDKPTHGEGPDLDQKES
jgi:type IV secretion system protein TrbL